MFQLPSPGSSGDEEEDGSHPSAVARTTGSVSDSSSSEKRQCEDRKKTSCASAAITNKKPVNLVAVEFLLDQQRSFLPSSRLQPFQVYCLLFHPVSLRVRSHRRT